MFKLGVLGIILEFIIVFILVLILNYFFGIRKNKKYNKKKLPLEALYLKKLYDVDIAKDNYKEFLWTYSLINTFIVATIYIILVYLVKNFILKILIGIVLLGLLIIICYGILGRIYIKKGDKDV